MPDPVSIAKTVFSAFGSLFSYFSKKYAQPKLEISMRMSMTNDYAENQDDDGVWYYHFKYHIEFQIINNSEHPAYHVKLTGCSLQILNNTIQYNLPIPSHDAKTYYMDLLYKVKIIKGDNSPSPRSPITEIRIEYDNAKGKRFFTVLSPKLPQEEQHKFGRV